MNRKRIKEFDFFRLFVIFLMIQGHTFRALLHPSLRDSTWFAFHEYIHGVTAPGFLFMAGFLFLYTFEPDNHKKLLVKFWRYTGIIAIGYWLHLPFFSLRKIIRVNSPEMWESFLQVDILQTIGASLIILLLTGILLKRKNWLGVTSLILTMLVLFFTPFMKELKFNALNPVIFYFDTKRSPFPLIPWSSHLFAGAFFAFLYSRLSVRNFYAFLLTASFIFLFTEKISFLSSVAPTLAALGKVLLLFLFSRLFVPFYERSLFLLRIAGESLFLYVFHIIIVYGSVLKKGLSHYFGRLLNLAETLSVFGLVLVISFVAAYIVLQIRKNKPLFYTIKYSLYGWFFIEFFKRPY